MRHKLKGQLMAERNPEKPKSPTKQLSDTDTSDEEEINSVLKTSDKALWDNTQFSISYTNST